MTVMGRSGDKSRRERREGGEEGDETRRGGGGQDGAGVRCLCETCPEQPPRGLSRKQATGVNEKGGFCREVTFYAF